MSEIDPEKLEEALNFYVDEEWAPKLAVIMAAARAHLATLPKWKEVEVWRVEYAEFCAILNGGEWVPRTRTFLDHRSAFDFGSDQDGCMSCISVTGPHKQRVPV